MNQIKCNHTAYFVSSFDTQMEFLVYFSYVSFQHFQHQSKSYTIVEEPHAVIQLDYHFKTLLVSTLFRSILVSGDASSKSRIGSKDRKV